MAAEGGLSPEQREANLRSWVKPQGHDGANTAGDHDVDVVVSGEPPLTQENATKVWFLVLKHLGKGGRSPSVIPKEFFDDVAGL